MQLTVKQEADVQRIMAEIDCPKGFSCYESKFEKLIPVKLYQGGNVIQCHDEQRLACQYGYEYGQGIVFCQCPMRRYAAFELSR